MSTIAHTYRFVVGVDTHARNHVYAITTNVGEIIDTRIFPTSNSGINRAMNWVARRTDDTPETLWVIEGAASYRALLTAAVTTCGFRVDEAPQLGRHLAAGKGKTDTLDAQRIAVATLPVDEARLRTHPGPITESEPLYVYLSLPATPWQRSAPATSTR
jgi:transposase